MSTALAILVKTPPYSRVKTRLAKAIGKSLATEFYWHCIEHLTSLEQPLLEQNIQPFWAVTEREAMRDWNTFPCIHSGTNCGLGERLHNTYAQLQQRFDTVILIGADLPQLCANDIIDAKVRASDAKHIVIGPSDDGGFWLFAGQQTIPKATWTNVQYSHTDTLKQLTHGLHDTLDNLEITYTSRHRDVDTIEDLHALDQCYPHLDLTRFLHEQSVTTKDQRPI